MVKKNKKTEGVIDVEKALEEKRVMQKQFKREHGYSSHVLALVIEHFEEMLEKSKVKKKGGKDGNKRD